MRILLSGASGLVGTPAASALRADGHEVSRFVRPRGTYSHGDVRWDSASGFVDAESMEGAEAIAIWPARVLAMPDGAKRARRLCARVG